jgi:hypothetical protein
MIFKFAYSTHLLTSGLVSQIHISWDKQDPNEGVPK